MTEPSYPGRKSRVTGGESAYPLPDHEGVKKAKYFFFTVFFHENKGRLQVFAPDGEHQEGHWGMLLIVKHQEALTEMFVG